jgi:hypothetical protein
MDRNIFQSSKTIFRSTLKYSHTHYNYSMYAMTLEIKSHALLKILCLSYYSDSMKEMSLYMQNHQTRRQNLMWYIRCHKLRDRVQGPCLPLKTLFQCFSTFVRPQPGKFFFIRWGPGPNKFTRKYLTNFLSSYIKLA